MLIFRPSQVIVKEDPDKMAQQYLHKVEVFQVTEMRDGCVYKTQSLGDMWVVMDRKPREGIIHAAPRVYEPPKKIPMCPTCVKNEPTADRKDHKHHRGHSAEYMQRGGQDKGLCRCPNCCGDLCETDKWW